MATSVGRLTRPVTIDTPDAERPPPPTAFRRETPIAPRDHAREAAVIALARGSAAASAEPSGAPRGPTNDRITYLGVNGDSFKAESARIRELRPDAQVLGAVAGDSVRHGGQRFDLATPDGRAAFLSKLGIRDTTARDVDAVLAGAVDGKRGTLAQLVIAWSAAERGGAVPSRLLLSGHSVGSGVFGATSGLRFDDVRALAKAMPQAARQIEDIHLSGCYTSEQTRSAQASWKLAFPNLKTMWGYAGYAETAPVHHFAAWESATRGRKEGIVPGAWLQNANVACWSVRNGYLDKNVDIAVLEQRRRDADAAFDGLMTGTPRMATSDSEPAKSHYGTYRSLGNRSERPDAPVLTRQADQLLALRHYEVGVRATFAETYREEVTRGFQAVGLPAPDYTRLSRAEALVKSRELRDAMALARPVPPAAAALERVLVALDTLDPAVIKPEWSMR